MKNYIFQATFQDRLVSCAPMLTKYLGTLTSKAVMFELVEMQHAKKKLDDAELDAAMPLLAAYFKDNAEALYRVVEVSDCLS